MHMLCTWETRQLHWILCQNVGICAGLKRSPTVSIPILKTLVSWDLTLHRHSFLDWLSDISRRTLSVHASVTPKVDVADSSTADLVLTAIWRPSHKSNSVCNVWHTNFLYPIWTRPFCLQISWQLYEWTMPKRRSQCAHVPSYPFHCLICYLETTVPVY